MQTSAGNLKKGDFVIVNSEIWQVLKTDFNYRGRGSATVKAKIKNIRTGTVIENTTKSDLQYEVPDIESVQMQFLYKDGSHAYFMDPRTFEQHVIDLSIIGDTARFLKEEDMLTVLLHTDSPLTIRPPQSVRLQVIEAQEAARGDTTTSPKKTVILETGVSVKVPLFIKKGDIIVINPETGEYVERAN